jgi:hypothetical protein
MTSYRKAFTITKHDTNLQPAVTKAIYVGGTGDLVVETSGGAIVTFSAVPVGAIIPIQAKRVRAATTATLLIGLY